MVSIPRQRRPCRVDTFTVWQIAQRDYRFGKSSSKTLNKVTYDAIGNHFRKLWGQEAGWAQSVLFTANLRSFADRLAATKNVDVKVKEENGEVDVETTVTTAVALAGSTGEEMGVKIEDSDIKSPAKGSRGKKRKGPAEGVVHASSTLETRRVSKRLRR